MVRYTLRQGSQTLYNGTSRTDSYNVAKSLGFVRIAGKPPTAECIVEEVGTLNGIQTYYWHKSK
jgi:hypothetical protein